MYKKGNSKKSNINTIQENDLKQRKSLKSVEKKLITNNSKSLTIGEDCYWYTDKMRDYLIKDPLLKLSIINNTKMTHKKMNEQPFKYKIKNPINIENILKMPTVVIGFYDDSIKMVSKYIYKFIPLLKNIDREIKENLDKNERIKEKEEKLQLINKIEESEKLKKEIEDTLKFEKNIFIIKNKNCLKINWVGDFENHYVYLSDYCSNKDLKRLTNQLAQNLIVPLHQECRVPFMNYMSENFIKFFTLQIINALECFKHMRIVHGNLTLDNLLINKNLEVKVTDFACSRFYKDDIFKIVNYSNEIQDLEYQPPEYFIGNNYIEPIDVHKIDIFSLACCIYYMATNNNLFYMNSIYNKEGDYTKMKYFIQNLNCFFSNNFKRSMLKINQKERVNIDELKGLLWIQKNNITIKNIEDINKNDMYKLTNEFLKSDQIQYYNKPLEYEKVYYNTQNKREMVEHSIIKINNYSPIRKNENKSISSKFKSSNKKTFKINGIFRAPYMKNLT